MDVNKENKYQVISVKRKVSIVTPGLGKILGSPYSISTTKTLYEG